ncbi:MAG: hypothetical protein Q9163_004018 [Psora crenata]
MPLDLLYNTGHNALRPPEAESVSKRIASGHVPLVLIILTPVHASLLGQHHPFLRDTLHASLGELERGQEVDALVAIVDRLSIPTISNIRPVDRLVYGTLTACEGHDGYHGISVAVLDSSLAAPDLWSHRKSPSHMGPMKMQQRSSLSFSFPGTNQVSRILQVPVANTIFENGMPATLFVQRWMKEDKSGELMCVKMAHLGQQTVHMMKRSTTAEDESDMDLQTKLKQITPPRTVSAAMGNIVRKIKGDEGQGQPASRELENIINDLISQEQLERDKVDIWALLKPQDDPTCNTSSNSRIGLHEDIIAGARLFRVLSGGGGWGEKQGLLALDPDSDYDIRPSPTYTANNDTLTEDEEGFADIVKPGDIITFFVNDVAIEKDTLKTPGGEPPSPVVGNLELRDPLLEFGCLPSTIDAMPDPQNSSGSSTFSNTHLLINKYFGILSSHGMSLKLTNPCQYRPQPHNGQGSVALRCSVTKLDAPYTITSIRRRSNGLAPKTGYDKHQPPLEAEVKAAPKGSQTTLAALEGSYRAQRLVARRDIGNGHTAQASSKTADKGNSVRHLLRAEEGRRDEDRSGNASQPAKLSIRKFMTRGNGRAVLGAFERFNKRKSEMNESTTQIYYDKLSQGASTAEALTYAEHLVDTGATSNRDPVRRLSQVSVRHSQYVSTRPRGEGLIRSYGVSDKTPRDKAKEGFRIAKHASISEKGKAMERYERSPITSRDQAKILHHQYLLALERHENNRPQ